eukprot:582642-Rhodomonas_salina.2
MSRPPTSKSTLSLCLFPRPSTQILTFPVLGRALALFLVRRSRSRASWSVERDRAEAPSLLSGDQSMMSGISLHQDQHELVKSVSWHVEELQPASHPVHEPDQPILRTPQPTGAPTVHDPNLTRPSSRCPRLDVRCRFSVPSADPRLFSAQRCVHLLVARNLCPHDLKVHVGALLDASNVKVDD